MCPIELKANGSLVFRLENNSLMKKIPLVLIENQVSSGVWNFFTVLCNSYLTCNGFTGSSRIFDPSEWSWYYWSPFADWDLFVTMFLGWVIPKSSVRLHTALYEIYLLEMDEWSFVFIWFLLANNMRTNWHWRYSRDYTYVHLPFAAMHTFIGGHWPNTSIYTAFLSVTIADYHYELWRL